MYGHEGMSFTPFNWMLGPVLYKQNERESPSKPIGEAIQINLPNISNMDVNNIN